MPTQLTHAAVIKFKPQQMRIEISDAGCRGLYLVIQPSGSKSWALRFRRPSGKPAKLTLGPVDLSGKEGAAEPVIGAPLTLAAARALAADLHRQRARKHDVVAIRHREKIEAKAGAAKTFGQAAVAFVEQHAMRHTRRWQEQARLLGLRPTGEVLEVIQKGLVDRWGDRPIAEINGDDIHGIVDEVRERGAPGLERRRKGPSEARARAMFSALSKMFGWLIEKRRVATNPCANVTSPKTPKARDRVLSNAEIVLFWAACDKASKPFGQLLRLLLLTGCRLNEVAGMRRSEFSEDGHTWTIPGSRTKNHREHVVPLASMARNILEIIGTDGELVFTTNGKTPISGWSKIKRRLDAAMLAEAQKGAKPAGRGLREVKIAPWRLHDLRRTAATGMAEIGIAPHIVEACLNHVSGARAGVAGTYNRAIYLPEKKAAFEAWTRFVMDLANPTAQTNVVELRSRS